MVVGFLLLGLVSFVGAQGDCQSLVVGGICRIARNDCLPGYSANPGVLPQCICECRPVGITNPFISGELSRLSGVQFLNKFISMALSFGFIIAAVVFFFMFITGGIKWITSGGDKNNVEMARNRITHATIGLLLTFALYVILGLIEDFFGLSLRQFNLPKLTD